MVKEVLIHLFIHIATFLVFHLSTSSMQNLSLQYTRNQTTGTAEESADLKHSVRSAEGGKGGIP